jgi:hypothetical protein
LQNVSSDANGGQVSPIRLTVQAKFEREALKLYQPISAYQIHLTRTNSDGERVRLVGTLDTRMTDYEDHVANKRREIEKLKADWETIVGEIWKVGVLCLGEETMESLLFTKKDIHEPSSLSTNAESTLSVPGQGTSPPLRTSRSKKRVTFETLDVQDDLPSVTNNALDFLYQPSRLRSKPVPAAPTMPEQELKKLETQVRELGKKEMEEYRKVEKAHKVYWQEMNTKLVNVLGETGC